MLIFIIILSKYFVQEDQKMSKVIYVLTLKIRDIGIIKLVETYRTSILLFLFIKKAVSQERKDKYLKFYRQLFEKLGSKTAHFIIIFVN